MNRLYVAIIVLLLLSAEGRAQSLIIDSFVDGNFVLSTDQSGGPSEQFGSMIGDDRIVSLSTSRRPTTVTASVVGNLGQLSFDTGMGSSGGLREQGSIVITYGGDRLSFPPDPLNFDLSSYRAFQIDILTLQGNGEVSVVLNSNGFGTGYTRLPLSTIGTFEYPFSAIVGSSISNVESIHFWFIGLSTDFAFTAGEIRAVPEPNSAGICLGLALAFVPFCPLRRGAVKSRSLTAKNRLSEGD